MSIPHAQPGEVISVRPYGAELLSLQTTVLIKTPRFELIRLVLPAGKVLHEHAAPGEITVQCIEGKITFTTMGKDQQLAAGDLIFLSAKELHAVKAIEDSSLLVTILFPQRDA